MISAKNDGVMPGFTVRDSAGQVWFIKFDPPGYPAMATGTEVLVARLFWGLGYHVPETHLATLRPEELTIDDQARITSPSGKRRRFKESDIRLLLRKAHRESDGSYRVVASKALEAARRWFPVLRHAVRRSQRCDPHEHRRELRGYGTFSAWLNHVDSKSSTRSTRSSSRTGNSRPSSPAGFRIDDRERGRLPARGVRRLGAPRRGQEDAGRHAEPRALRQELADDPLYRAKSVGAFPIDNTQWDPERWKPATPIPRSDRRAWTTSSGPRGGSRHSPTRC